MEQHNIAKYGLHMGKQPGWIAVLGDESFSHRFGGQTWNVSHDSHCPHNHPALLIKLDLNDERLQQLRYDNATEIPLYSRLFSGDLSPQVYKIDADMKTVRFNTEASCVAAEGKKLLQPPLPERKLKLIPMNASHLPIDENSYWQACDSFVGGRSFIRILGAPVWLQWVEAEKCMCGRDMEYIASIGYEPHDSPSGLLDGKPFFIGELALYFFLCKSCACVHVISQST